MIQFSDKTVQNKISLSSTGTEAGNSVKFTNNTEKNLIARKIKLTRALESLNKQYLSLCSF